MYILSYVTIKSTFKIDGSAKMIKVSYMVINAPLPYSIMIGRSTFSALEAALLTLYLTMKYSLSSGRVEVIKGVIP